MSSPDRTIFTAVEPHCQQRQELRAAATHAAQAKLFLCRARRTEYGGRRSASLSRLADAIERIVVGIMLLTHGAAEEVPDDLALLPTTDTAVPAEAQ